MISGQAVFAGHCPAVGDFTYLLQASYAAVFAGLASDYNSLALQVMVTREM
jgi:hypothetical protein